MASRSDEMFPRDVLGSWPSAPSTVVLAAQPGMTDRKDSSLGHRSERQPRRAFFVPGGVAPQRPVAAPALRQGTSWPLRPGALRAESLVLIARGPLLTEAVLLVGGLLDHLDPSSANTSGTAAGHLATSCLQIARVGF